VLWVAYHYPASPVYLNPLALKAHQDFLKVAAYAQALIIFTNSLNWYVRKAGIPILPFSGTSNRHPLPTRPKLKDSSWLFFMHEPGCGGTPPTLYAEFKLVCGQ
jgi:hypothetical protein